MPLPDIMDDGEKGGFKLALCTVIFVQGDKLTSLRSVSLSRIRVRIGRTQARSSPSFAAVLR